MQTYDKHSFSDELWMSVAIHEARKAAAISEVPVGACLVQDDRLISTGYNTRESDSDVSMHAEMIAIKNACATLGSWRLSNCSLYVTLEPCMMCAGAVFQSRIARVVFGASDPKAGALGGVIDIASNKDLNHHTSVEKHVLEYRCSQLLKTFFRDLRTKRKSRKI